MKARQMDEMWIFFVTQSGRGGINKMGNMNENTRTHIYIHDGGNVWCARERTRGSTGEQVED